MQLQLNILVATDYSKAAINAEKYAIELAKDTEAQLTFLHIFEQSIGFPQELVNMERMEDSPTEFETRRLRRHVEELCQSLHVRTIKYTCTVKKGNPSEELIKLSSEEKVDFMITGTHKASIFHRTFMGSHTWDAIKHVKIPILSIPEEASYKGISSIVFATEYRESELPLIKTLANFSKAFQAELTVLHITDYVFSKEFERKLFETFTNELKNLIPYNKLNLRLVYNENLLDGLNGFCLRNNASWLVMSHEKTSALLKILNPQSATKRMSFHTYVPLLTMPDKYEASSDLEKKLAIDEGHNIK